MKELSIFVDESGDFGRYSHISPYYIIGIVLHDQGCSINKQVQLLDRHISETNLSRGFVHVGPLIRREAEYKQLTIMERRHILRSLLSFSRNVAYTYKAFLVNKKETKTEVELTSKLTKQLSEFINENLNFFNQYDKIKIYYDNGQSGVIKIIVAVFTALFSSVEFKDARQEEYRLLQVADLVCTAALIEQKMHNKELSKSEHALLGNDRDIKQCLLKPIHKKEFRR